MPPKTTTSELGERRKAITSFATSVPGLVPSPFIVQRGTTLPADHPVVQKLPYYFVSPDHADSDLPSEYNRVELQRERERTPAPLPPEKVAVCIQDFAFRPPGSDGNRIVRIRRGDRLPVNAHAVRWHRRMFKLLSELTEAGRIGPLGQLLPPSPPTQPDRSRR